MFFKVFTHQLYLEPSTLHRGLKARITSDGWMFLIGGVVVTYSNEKLAHSSHKQRATT